MNYKEFEEIVAEYKKQDVFISDQWLENKKAEFIYTSNKLEGNKLSFVDTYSVIKDRLKFSNEVRFHDILEAKGHIKALDTCVFMVKNKYPLTEKTLQTLNANLLSALWKFDEYYASWKEKKQELGLYKVIENSIEYFLDGKKGVIKPISNKKNIDKNMQLVLSENKKIKHILERTAHLAFQIWINQPFPDGNKRTARLAVVYNLMEFGLPLISFKADGTNFNEALLRSYEVKNLKPLVDLIQMEVKQQLTEMMQISKELKKDRKPPTLGSGLSLLF